MRFFLPAILLLCVATAFAVIPPKKGIPMTEKFKQFQSVISKSYSNGYWAERMREREKKADLISEGLLNKSALDVDSVHAVTLLGKFSNLAPKFTAEDFQELLFDGPNPTGTVTQFYDEISYGQEYFTGTCTGWYSVPGTVESYAYPGVSTETAGPRFVHQVLLAADSTFNFADYIQYYDGNTPHIGFIAVVHTGGDAAAGAPNIWSHRYSFAYQYGAYTTNDTDPVSGKKVIIDGDYAIEPELLGSSNFGNSLVEIGVFAHEFGHIFGLPDLYDTDYSSTGVGNWCLMSGGSYGGDGQHENTPAQMSAWCKKKLGWIIPTNITSLNRDVVIPNVEENPVLYRLWLNGTAGNQYFLIENRQKIKSDAYIYGSGLLIWHCDDSRNTNSNENHPWVDLEQADGLRNLNNNNNGGDAGDPFPGVYHNTRFDDNSNPNSKDYNLASTNVSVRNIRGGENLNMIADLDIGTAPFVEVDSAAVAEQTVQDGRLEQGETGNVFIKLKNISSANATNATIHLSTSEAGITLLTDQVNFDLNGNSEDSVVINGAFSVSSDFISRMVYINYTIETDGNQFADSIEFVAGIPKFLIISKAEKPELNEYYREALRDYDYEFVYNKEPEYLGDRDNVIIFTGKNETSLFSENELAAITSGLSAGKNYLISGQNIAEGLNTENPDFLHNTLKVNWVKNATVFYKNTFGDTADVIGAQITKLRLNGGEGANNDLSMDVIEPLTDFHKSLSYKADGSETAAGWWEDGTSHGKLFFAGFGLESINNTESSISRDSVLYAVLNWFNLVSGVKDDYNTSVRNYTLSQNYPNPFNPSTVINYSIPREELVTLKVYDILGKEVATLVNERQNSGSYKVDFNARNLSSGVYFYSLKAGDFTAVKKLMLMK